MHFTTFHKYCNIFARILVAKPHSADVERLISASNLLKSPLRSTMSVKTENMYLYIHYNMPPLYEWDPNMSIVKWIKSKKHRIITRKKAKEQNYFNGVFPEAKKKHHQIENTNTDTDEELVIKKKKKHFKINYININC